MASSMYELALQLEQELNKISSKKGHVVFRTLKGETKFVFQFEKNHAKGLVIQLLKNEEELAFVTTIEKKCRLERATRQSELDLQWLSKGIQIRFDKKSIIYDTEIQRMERLGIEVEKFEVLPNILNFTEENIGKNTAVTNQNRKFVEQVFTLVLQEGNLEKLELVWNKQQKNYYQTYPVFTFNQRTKEINYVQQEKMLALKDIPKYQYYVSNIPAELQISEFEFADFMERIEVTVNVSMQVRIGVQELVSSQISKQNIPFVIEMADKDAVAYTKLIDSIDPKIIQEEFLEMFAEFQFKPTTILVSGLFGVYLSNVLTPLAKRMSIKIKQVDNLPTFNRLTPEERIVSFLNLYGISV